MLIKNLTYSILICIIISGCAGPQKTKSVVSRYTQYFGYENISKIQFAHTYQIPNYQGSAGRVFTDITFDYDERRFHLPSDRGMGQFPLSGNNVDFNSGFTAATKPYRMVAFACNPLDGKMLALDGGGRHIITDKPNSRKIPLPSEIGKPTGMCHDGANVWICDLRGKIFKLTIKAKSIKIEETFESPLKSPRGIAWDGFYLWVCSKNHIARITNDGKILFMDNLFRDIDGICIVKGNLWAIAYNKPEIYRFAVLE